MSHIGTKLAATAFAMACPALQAADSAAVGYDPAAYHQKGITGMISIDYRSRLHPGQPGHQDQYQVGLNVGRDAAYVGTILRTPLIPGTVGIKQAAGLEYELAIRVFNPNDRSESIKAGALSGMIEISGDGLYSIPEANGLRTLMTHAAAAPSASFTGTIQGRKLGASRLGELLADAKAASTQGIKRSFTRWIEGKPLTIEAAKTDPMTFQRFFIPGGPAKNYPGLTLNGDMVYDYATDSWIFDKLTLEHADGSGTDRIGGTIQWIQDSETSGHYNLNVTFNEQQASAEGSTAAAFFSSNDQGAAAFFAVDEGTPTCSGAVRFSDTYPDQGESPIASRVEHQVTCNDRVTPQQVMALGKLWLIAIGPLTDE